MSMYQSRIVRPSLPALAVGAPLLIVGSLLRATGQPLLDISPIAAASLTCLVFVIPAVVAGAIAPRAAVLDGAILGLIGAAFVTLQSAQFHPPNWSSPLVYETIGLFACLGVPLCTVGAVLGGRLFRKR
jgi:CDP-diglyceride synthetase